MIESKHGDLEEKQKKQEKAFTELMEEDFVSKANKDLNDLLERPQEQTNNFYSNY